MKAFKAWIAGLAIVGAALGWTTVAQAAPLQFTLTGTTNVSFVLDSDPTPDTYNFGISVVFFNGPGVAGHFAFFSSAIGGGLTIEDHGYSGAQLYSGPEIAPHFDPGTFNLVGFGDGSA